MAQYRGMVHWNQSGFLVIAVPANIVKGAFAALDAEGITLPKLNGKVTSNIVLMDPHEVQKIGASKITERGKEIAYELREVKSRVIQKDGIERLWYLDVKPDNLNTLRQSYGLKPRNYYGVVFAVRRLGVLKNNPITKVSRDDQHRPGDAGQDR